VNVIVLLMGLLFVGATTVAFRKNRRLARHGLPATGQVVALNKSTSVSDDGIRTRMYRPVVTFRTADGQEIRFNGPGSSRPVARPGDVVPVLYDPAHPATAEINTLRGRGTVVLTIVGLAGIGLIVFGSYLLI
jgi:hypothetical protein